MDAVGAPVVHRRIEVDGIDTFYRESGPAGGPVVLLPHGYRASSYAYRNLMAGLGVGCVKFRRRPLCCSGRDGGLSVVVGACLGGGAAELGPPPRPAHARHPLSPDFRGAGYPGTFSARMSIFSI